MWAGRYQPTPRTQVIQNKNKVAHYQIVLGTGEMTHKININ